MLLAEPVPTVPVPGCTPTPSCGRVPAPRVWLWFDSLWWARGTSSLCETLEPREVRASTSSL